MIVVCIVVNSIGITFNMYLHNNKNFLSGSFNITISNSDFSFFLYHFLQYYSIYCYYFYNFQYHNHFVKTLIYILIPLIIATTVNGAVLFIVISFMAVAILADVFYCLFAVCFNDLSLSVALVYSIKSYFFFYINELIVVFC